MLKKKTNTAPAECIIHQPDEGIKDFPELIDSWLTRMCVYDIIFCCSGNPSGTYAKAGIKLSSWLVSARKY